MAMRRTLCPEFIFLGALLSLAAGACVEPFGGSSVIAVFDEGVQTVTPAGETPEAGRPPPGTYYAFYSVDITYQDEDGDGIADTDEDGFPIPLTSYASEAQRFEIVPLINRASPCFIELEEARYPGLHVTMEANKFSEQTGIDLDDPFHPPEGTPETDVTDVLTSLRRMSLLAALESEIKAVVDLSQVLGPGDHPDYPVATECVEDNPEVDPTLIPPPNCIGADSNAHRLEICRQYWEEYPDYYEGSDKVFTLPLNGTWHGAVDGSNPKNNGFLSGAQFYCEAALADFDAILMNWQYKDMDGDGVPDYPDDLPEEQHSTIGYHYMQGTPHQQTLSTITVPLAHRLLNITGKLNIIPSLNEDDVHF